MNNALSSITKSVYADNCTRTNFYKTCLRLYSFLPGLPFMQEETERGFNFPLSSNSPLLFKRMSVLAEYHVRDVRQIHWRRGSFFVIR